MLHVYTTKHSKISCTCSTQVYTYVHVYCHTVPRQSIYIHTYTTHTQVLLTQLASTMDNIKRNTQQTVKESHLQSTYISFLCLQLHSDLSPNVGALHVIVTHISFTALSRHSTVAIQRCRGYRHTVQWQWEITCKTYITEAASIRYIQLKEGSLPVLMHEKE